MFSPLHHTAFPAGPMMLAGGSDRAVAFTLPATPDPSDPAALAAAGLAVNMRPRRRPLRRFLQLLRGLRAPVAAAKAEPAMVEELPFELPLAA